MLTTTLKPQSKMSSISKVVIYIFAILGAGILVFFGGNFIKKLDLIKGKSKITVSVLEGTADVYLGDTKLGTTPYQSADIKPGNNKVTIKNSLREYETNIEFLPNSEVVLNRDLGISDIYSSGQNFWLEKSESGTVLSIISQPSDAAIFIDNTEVGKTPYSTNTLSKGDYDLRVELPGYETQTARIKIEKGYNLNVSADLYPIPVPSKIAAFEGSQNLFNIHSTNPITFSDTQTWVKAILYWNKTRGLDVNNTGLNKEYIFNYFLDYLGTVFDDQGNKVTDIKTFKNPDKLKRGAYLSKIIDGEGLTTEAKQALQALQADGSTGGTIAAGSKVKIKPTETGWLRVREQPSISGTEVSKVTVGMEFELLEKQEKWVKIKVSETTSGWVSADYVEIKGTSAVTPAVITTATPAITPTITPTVTPSATR